MLIDSLKDDINKYYDLDLSKKLSDGEHSTSNGNHNVIDSVNQVTRIHLKRDGLIWSALILFGLH